MNNRQVDQWKPNRALRSRRSRQREVVLSVLRDYHGHLDVYSVYLRAKEKGGRLSLSTVYRALRHLIDQGLVRQVVFDHGGRFYETVKPIEDHHLLCLGCGGIVEMSPVLGEEELRLLEKTGVDLVEIRVSMKGYCPSWSRRRQGVQTWFASYKGSDDP